MDSQDQTTNNYMFFISYGTGYLHIDESRRFIYDKSTIEMLKKNNGGHTGT